MRSRRIHRSTHDIPLVSSGLSLHQKYVAKKTKRVKILQRRSRGDSYNKLIQIGGAMKRKI